MLRKRIALIAVPAVIAVAAAGCGGSSNSSKPAAAAGSTTPGALAAEAQSAATGDIPDNQNFLTFKDAAAGFSMKYPEGWAQKKAPGGITFQDKNNLVRVDVHQGAAPTVASVQQELAKLKASSPTLVAQTPASVTVKGKPGIKVSYTTTSAPNQVTGKRVTLIVDRYEFAKNGRVAVLDLGTAKGVDNVDAYRLMSESFTWL
ncbi:MAG: hypothetical protein QOJ57_2878 [Thermoleophilaceae bacterium]|jgi:hypothetical protein|nr:hypothetical protein [Thermoleophilaceae bacterium]